MGDTVMTLWILFCRMSKKWDTLFAFYAKDREDLALRQGTPSPAHLIYQWIQHISHR